MVGAQGGRGDPGEQGERGERGPSNAFAYYDNSAFIGSIPFGPTSATFFFASLELPTGNYVVDGSMEVDAGNEEAVWCSLARTGHSLTTSAADDSHRVIPRRGRVFFDIAVTLSAPTQIQFSCTLTGTSNYNQSYSARDVRITAVQVETLAATSGPTE